MAPDENAAGTVYGVILIAALLAAEDGNHDSYLETIASALIATVLYWLAHAYAEALGRRLIVDQRHTLAALGHALRHDVAIVRGAALPVLVLVIAWASGASQHTGVTAALWAAIAAVVCLELIAGLRSRASSSELALDVGVGAAIGIAILALKVVLR